MLIPIPLASRSPLISRASSSARATALRLKYFRGQQHPDVVAFCGAWRYFIQ
jgi:hypothetical protein